MYEYLAEYLGSSSSYYYDSTSTIDSYSDETDTEVNEPAKETG